MELIKFCDFYGISDGGKMSLFLCSTKIGGFYRLPLPKFQKQHPCSLLSNLQKRIQLGYEMQVFKEKELPLAWLGVYGLLLGHSVRSNHQKNQGVLHRRRLFEAVQIFFWTSLDSLQILLRRF